MKGFIYLFLIRTSDIIISPRFKSQTRKSPFSQCSYCSTNKSVENAGRVAGLCDGSLSGLFMARVKLLGNNLTVSC